MQVDTKLKQELIEKLPDSYESIPVYPIRRLSPNEINENAKYCATQFMGTDSLASFRSIEKREDSMLINLPWDAKMWIYYNSNAIYIKRKMKPLEHLINQNLHKSSLARIAIQTMSRLKLDKWKFSFEHLEFE